MDNLMEIAHSAVISIVNFSHYNLLPFLIGDNSFAYVIFKSARIQIYYSKFA